MNDLKQIRLNVPDLIFIMSKREKGKLQSPLFFDGHDSGVPGD
jgi:hypothetical protein